jgi:hypothetical protein
MFRCWHTAARDALFPRSGIISSGTHYSNYHDHGLQGVDLIYVLDGYTMHTPRDNMDAVMASAVQQSGDNLMLRLHEAFPLSLFLIIC